MGALVRVERDGAVAHIVLARPEAGNAISLEVAQQLRAATDQCARDPGIRAVLLRSEGKAFCVGGDIAEFEAVGEARPAHVLRLVDAFHAAEAQLLGMRMPVIVAVQGAAAGAGMMLALLGDLVLAGRSASFTTAYTAIGLSADGASTYLLPRLIGLRRTQELLMTNRRLSAAEALQWGLVTDVVDDAELAARAEDLARRLAAGPTVALGVIKRLLAQSFQTDFAAQTDLEGQEIARLSGEADGVEGIAAFRAKRTPVFRGGTAS